MRSPSFWQKLRLCSLFVLTIFSFQTLFQSIALAERGRQLAAEIDIDELMVRLEDRVDSAESWDDFKFLLAPLGVDNVATTITMIHESLARNYHYTKVATKGACHAGLSSFLEYMGMRRSLAQSISRYNIWAFERQADACAQRVLKEIKDRTLPLFEDFKAKIQPEWDGHQIKIGNLATLSRQDDSSVFVVDGTHAKIDLLSWMRVGPSATAIGKKLEKLKADTGRTKSSWLQNLLMPNAYALSPAIFIAVAVIVLLIVAMMVHFNGQHQASREAFIEFYTKLKKAILSRKAQLILGKQINTNDLVDEFIDYAVASEIADYFGTTPHELLVPRNVGKKPELLEPCDEFECSQISPGSLVQVFFACAMSLIDLNDNQPDQLIRIVDYMRENFLDQSSGLRRDRIEALAHLADRIVEVNSSPDVVGKAIEFKTKLLMEPVGYNAKVISSIETQVRKPVQRRQRRSNAFHSYSPLAEEYEIARSKGYDPLVDCCPVLTRKGE